MLLAISRQVRRFMPLRANLETEPQTGERRSAPRRKLRLQAEGAIASAGDTQVVIHDISEEGLLIESPVPLTDGEVLEVLIPEAGTAQAQVSWTSGHFFGCKFIEPISTAAVSAALLRSPAPGTTDNRSEVVQKALVELESLSFAIKRVTKAVDQAIDRLTKK
jgi:PilZ domain